MLNTYTMMDLVHLSGVNARTIRYYISEGLLPGPQTLGKSAGYSDRHLDRLKLIVLMKNDHSLGEIKDWLDSASREDIQLKLLELQEWGSPEPEPEDSFQRNELTRSPNPRVQSRYKIRALGTETWKVLRIAFGVELHLRNPDSFTLERMEQVAELIHNILIETESFDETLWGNNKPIYEYIRWLSGTAPEQVFNLVKELVNEYLFDKEVEVHIKMGNQLRIRNRFPNNYNFITLYWRQKNEEIFVRIYLEPTKIREFGFESVKETHPLEPLKSELRLTSKDWLKNEEFIHLVKAAKELSQRR